jgi:hypothetical protein
MKGNISNKRSDNIKKVRTEASANRSERREKKSVLRLVRLEKQKIRDMTRLELESTSEKQKRLENVRERTNVIRETINHQRDISTFEFNNKIVLLIEHFFFD